jgi:hypothetical protein
MADSKNALQPATITHLDMRSRGAEVADSCHRGDRSARPLRLCTWNIERGYKLDLVIQQLKEIDAGGQATACSAAAAAAGLRGRLLQS